MRACCPRCRGTLRAGAAPGAGRARTAAIAAAALVLYPLAVTLPVIRIERFGHTHEAGILEGVVTLLGQGHLLIGVIVLLCSAVFPVAKLAALLALSIGGLGLARHHQALTYRLVDLTGRWGMLDVLLVAILVAVLKLGDIVEVQVGPGAVAFALCVGTSLLAAASFDPRTLWDSGP